MGGYYRLRELKGRLESGFHIIPAKKFGPIDQATAILEAAEERAAEIVADAERIYAQEKARGYEEGREDARLESIERLLGEQRTLDIALQNVEHDLARLVSFCVRKLIDGFDDTTRAETVLRHALAKMRREKRVDSKAPQIHASA